jgi:ferredoxin-NADP reductase
VSSGTRVTPDPEGRRPARLEWHVGTVVDVRAETARTRTIVLDVPHWPGHRAGQHVDVRLVAEDGYQAQRSYSIASPPEEPTVALTVDRLDDGEVSPYLVDTLQVGDGLEVRGPIGGHFVWSVADGGPLLLVGGGSGVVPLTAMLRHYARSGALAAGPVPIRLLYSARSLEDLIYREELEGVRAQPEVSVVITLTRRAPPGWTGRRGRIDHALLEAVAWAPATMPRTFVCGSSPFVESVATALVELGHDPSRIRTERFGPTG